MQEFEKYSLQIAENFLCGMSRTNGFLLVGFNVERLLYLTIDIIENEVVTDEQLTHKSTNTVVVPVKCRVFFCTLHKIRVVSTVLLLKKKLKFVEKGFLNKLNTLNQLKTTINLAVYQTHCTPG